jgi:hypothetical protein
MEDLDRFKDDMKGITMKELSRIARAEYDFEMVIEDAE